MVITIVGRRRREEMMGEKRTRDRSRRRKKEKKRNQTTPTWMVVGAYTEHKENCDRPPQRSRTPQPSQQVCESPPGLFATRQAAWLIDQGKLLKDLAEIIMDRLNKTSAQLEELCKQQFRDDNSNAGAAGNNNGEGGATQDPSSWDFATGSFPLRDDIASTRGEHTSDDTFQCGSRVVVSHGGWAAGFEKGFGKGLRHQQSGMQKGCCGKGRWRIREETTTAGSDVDGVSSDQSNANNGGRVLIGSDGRPW